MKKFSLYIVLFVSISLAKVSAQVNTNQLVANNVADSNAFFDASTNFNTSASSSNSIGKGLVFPDTNLTLFEFDSALADGITFPSYFDGMLVFNTGTGSTADPSLTTQTTGLVPGWYYFSNPNGAANGSVAAGRWLPVGGNPRFDVTNTETITNTLVNGNQVYAKKGTFTVSGSSTAPTSYAPAPITVPASATAGIYRVTIYRAGTGSVFANGVYSYDITNGNLITGSPSMSVVYPAGTYDYIVEYTK
ncbi:hypothetical protein ATE47_11225 [Chryseobacterium sp. IHB B 17019]|jgi:hypothetical protein|uniref:hypothetical protein n=1 Tax=Chryseobacterium sp. IHB B 17019 TaxID=1721091 RepID=UPI000720A7F9|nr:hypothetical protein [Chryseobacterium sp. IHB B 17019]ALR31060.1 hypothetical protein ATE47_11225 [Chryseobacterium sp. IHB B 17019]